MSGTSYSNNCYKCGGNDTILASSDYKPYDCVSGECIQCGFTYWTITGQMKLNEVNEIREMCDLTPLKKLIKQTQQ